MRVFTTNDKYVRFAPRSGEDVEAAEQASDYVNYIIIQSKCDGYKLLHTFFKDALLFRAGVIKFFYEEVEEVDEEEYFGLSEPEMVILLNDPASRSCRSPRPWCRATPTRTAPTCRFDVQYDMSVRVTRKSGEIKAINVPPEEFLVSRHAVSLDDAHFVAHRTSMTVSELVAMGYDRDIIEQYAGENELDTDREVNNRFQDLRGGDRR